jgi:radical S-adenosyl methionine domain-containing protein 2
MLVETVNLHIWSKCNLKCVYCYGTFPERPRSLSLADWRLILDELRDHGVVRVSFSGGEPTLHPELLGMLRHAREIGLETSIITNGATLDGAMLDELDAVGITLDAASDDVLVRLGRGLPGGRSYVEHTRDIVRRARQAGCRVKINTVVTSLNVDEDVSAEIIWLRPYKWKAMQFTEVPGENDRGAARLHVSEAEFRRFVDNHAPVREAGIWVEAESASVIQRTYVMIDPSGRLFQHGVDGHRTSPPVLDVGIEAALALVGGYDREAFVGRGGHVDVRRLPVLGGAR